jgi:hypothetical protein
MELTAKTCLRDGCERTSIFARGMCKSHYNVFMRKKRRINGVTTIDSWQILLDAMPGTYSQLAERVGMHYGTVQKIVSEKYQAGLTHKVDHLEPHKLGGTRWVPVYGAGPGNDHVVTDARKRNYMLAGRRMARTRSAARRFSSSQ